MNPQFIYEYESNSEEYSIGSATVHEFEVGILGQYSKQKINIQTPLRKKHEIVSTSPPFTSLFNPQVIFSHSTNHTP